MRSKAGKPSAKASTVYFGSVKVSKPEADATLPAKLGRILDKLNLKKLCGEDWVPIKMHLGGGLGYTTAHPVFVRTIVEAVKKAGGKPFVVDGYFDTIASAASRGYTQETLGCPLVSAGGVYNSHLVSKKIGYQSYDEAKIFGAIWDAPCLINFSHVKGHGACAYGGACKNIAMGCVDGPTRHKIHHLEGGIEWSKAKCVFCGRCVKACDTGAISMDKKAKELEIFFHHCRYCRHCVSACPREALILNDAKGFKHFQEGMALTTKAVLEKFPPERLLHVNLLTNLTMFCDCWGMSSQAIVPDIGVMASHDIVAIEKASLDMIKEEDFIEGSLIGGRKLGKGGHLLEKIHGKDPMVQVKALERHGLGSMSYKIEEVS